METKRRPCVRKQAKEATEKENLTLQRPNIKKKATRPPLGAIDSNIEGTTQCNPEGSGETYREANKPEIGSSGDEYFSSEDIAGAGDADREFPVDLQNVTTRRSIYCAQHSHSTTPELFVESKDHCISDQKAHLPLKDLSPIKPSFHVLRASRISQGIPENLRKLAKTKSLRRPRKDYYCGDIYNDDYLDDIVKTELQNEWKHVQSFQFHKMHNPSIFDDRASCCNWLSRVGEYMDLAPCTLFKTVRLFDKVLQHTSVASSMCQLVALVVLWIVCKFDDNNTSFTIKRMGALCNNIYQPHDFKKMERKLLKFFDFNIMMSDVTLFVDYYLRTLQIDSELYVYCAHYILECFTLSINFSTVPASKQAAAAVYLTLAHLQQSPNPWSALEGAPGYCPPGDMERLLNEMKFQVLKVQHDRYRYTQAYKKYSTKEKSQASAILLRKIVQ